MGFVSNKAAGFRQRLLQSNGVGVGHDRIGVALDADDGRNPRPHVRQRRDALRDRLRAFLEDELLLPPPSCSNLIRPMSLFLLSVT